MFDHFSPTVSRTTYLALGGVAIFVLLTACINFINLATARALKRAREVGVRKTLGSSRWQLILQFLMETGIVTVIAVVLAIGLTAAFLPAATAWLDVRLADNVLFRSDVIGLLALLTVVVVLLAGIYPAFVQSNFQAATSLKGAVRTGGLSLRKSLVVTQFVISQVMIAGTLVVTHQMDFFRNGNLGFDKEAVISLPVPDAGKRDVFAAQLAAMPGIKDYSFAVAAPVYGGPATSFQNKFMSAHDVVDMKMVDERYFNMFQLKMLAGEPVRQTPRTDTTRPVVINATMARILGHKTPEAALGQQFELGGMSVMINGVVKDFQQGSRHKLIRSAVLFYNPDAFRSVSVKLSGRNMQQQIAGIEKAWTTLFPQAAFTYEFLDDHIASLYRQEQKHIPLSASFPCWRSLLAAWVYMVW
ncbi:FtsX-like permease family protein [Chitinophaga sedimenti]|uniref:FtsX-like permease family protein n=1 Tax=Chitinophaga sedimenti TaxID=2033606 RepID=UPI0027E18EE5|nr:FtsX-like permease family protein [Chitinophaga sedimenti]